MNREQKSAPAKDEFRLREADQIITLFDLLQSRLHACAVNKGWWEPERSVPECLALIHSEVSEALEEYRRCGPGCPLQNTISGENGKPEGLPIELADILIRVFDLAEALGIRLGIALLTKHGFNRTRSQRHGGKHC